MGPEFTLTECPESEVLAAEWTALEPRGDPSFFQSWTWIRTWLDTLEAPPLLLRAQIDNTTVALGFLGENRRLARPASYLLNQTGRPEEDSIYIEFNGILCDRNHPDLEAACWQWLARETGSPIPGLSPKLRLDRLSARSYGQFESAGLRFKLEKQDVAPFADLQQLHGQGLDFIESLGRNTRQQIRRTGRLYETEGPVALQAAESLPEAREFLAGLIELHQKYWTAKGNPGAFAPAYFRRFHEQLVQSGLEAGSVELLRLTAGARVIGYLYNFRYGDGALSYQSGFDYPEDNRYKPGLYCHALAAQRYLETGLKSYSFLAGDSRYKRALSNAEEPLYSLTARLG